jgi:YidC/Oxa1 family membrane protein insertase
VSQVFQPLIDFFESILVFFHDTVGLGWGGAIVALTIVVRAALMPLTIKQFKSMQNMAKFQPEIKKLQERYKGDRERLNQEMMKFYRENKVNPFASCLPLVAQLPVFLALFYMLRTDLRLDVCPAVNPPGTTNPQPCGPGGAAEFLFIPDITDNATGGVLVVLLILYVGSQLLSTLLMSTATDRTQKIIFLALPFFFVPFIISFPAGLLVYWITTNLWTIVQQAIVRKRLGPLRPHSEDAPMSLMDRMLHRGSTPPPTAAGASPGSSASAGTATASSAKTTAGRPAAAARASGSGGSSGGSSGGTSSSARRNRSAPPPPSPRKKKKRSGRRR